MDEVVDEVIVSLLVYLDIKMLNVGTGREKVK